MAYEKHTWECGETITAELLNALEGGVEQAQNGYSVETNCVELFDETVTTSGNMADLSYSSADAPDSLDITFNGVLYEGVPYDSSMGFYGDFSLTTYPFVLSTPTQATPTWGLIVASDGTYTVSAKTCTTDVETTDSFRMAVREISGAVVRIGSCIGKTFNELVEAVESGKTVFQKVSDLSGNTSYYALTSLQQGSVNAAGNIYKYFAIFERYTLAYDNTQMVATEHPLVLYAKDADSNLCQVTIG